MAEHDDELHRLRRADPVDPGSLPSATDRRARALFEEITMSDAVVTVRPGEGPDRHAATRRPPARLVALAAAAVAVLGTVALVAGGAGDRVRDEPTPDPGVGPGIGNDAPITPGGMASCVEVYDLATLARREMAFDGTVSVVRGDLVTFRVNAAYHGTEGSTVTLQGASSLTGVTSAGTGAPLAPGTRLLVAGDGGFAWGCGFTQPYDDDVAAQWAATFRR